MGITKEFSSVPRVSRLLGVAAEMGAHEGRRTLHGILLCGIVRESTDIRRAEIEATADARVEDKPGLLSILLQRADRRLDLAAVLILFPVSYEDEYGNDQLVYLRGVAVDLHRLRRIGILQVGLPRDVAGCSILLAAVGRRRFQREITTPGKRDGASAR
jgi:hypothetical protein